MEAAGNLMVWQLIISETALKQLKKLDQGIAKKIKSYLEDLTTMKDPADKGHALAGPWAGFHTYHIGQLRVVVSLDRNVITLTVVKVDRRDSVY